MLRHAAPRRAMPHLRAREQQGHVCVGARTPRLDGLAGAELSSGGERRTGAAQSAAPWSPPRAEPPAQPSRDTLAHDRAFSPGARAGELARLMLDAHPAPVAAALLGTCVSGAAAVSALYAELQRQLTRYVPPGGGAACGNGGRAGRADGMVLDGAIAAEADCVGGARARARAAAGCAAGHRLSHARARAARRCSPSPPPQQASERAQHRASGHAPPPSSRRPVPRRRERSLGGSALTALVRGAPRDRSSHQPCARPRWSRRLARSKKEEKGRIGRVHSTRIELVPAAWGAAILPLN